MSTPSFPYGSAVCEVEVDPETGAVEIVRYSSVDDVGRAINPLIVHGQTHGGIAQGVGQALWELSDYDPESGQLRSATFMDYAMPRADLLPSFATEISEVESTSNPLGLRGGGEGGTTPALGAVVNAIVDALAELGVEHIEMPATPGARLASDPRRSRADRASASAGSVAQPVGERRHPRVDLAQVVVGDRGAVGVEHAPQLAHRLRVHVDAQIHVREGAVLVDQQGGGLLAPVLAARVAARLDAAQQALLQVLVGIRGEGALHRLQDVLAGQVVAEHDVVVAHPLAGPVAVLACRCGRPRSRRRR